MKTYRKTAIALGILFLVGYVGVFAGSAFYAPILDAPDYLGKIYPNESQLVVGMLIELLNDIAVVGIAVMLFPILKRYGEASLEKYTVSDLRFKFHNRVAMAGQLLPNSPIKRFFYFRGLKEVENQFMLRFNHH